ncbi:MAG: porin [Hyphomonadaceae bacterium]
MRNWIIGAAAILAVAVPGVAAAQTGYVGATYSNVDIDGADNADAYGVEGAVAFAGSGSIVFEVDAALSDSDDTDTGYGLTGHVYARNDDHLFGGFVGIAGSDDTETWTAGLEASKFFTNWTLAGAVAYANNDDFNVDGWGVNAQARYFIHDNFRLQGNIGWATIDDGVSGDDDAMSYGVGAEYQFAALPISVGASWNTVDSDGPDADVIGVSVRYNWGGTLRDRDRNGASQADITGLGGFLF